MWSYNYDYLSHGLHGFKYIDKKMGKNGKWQYIYDEGKKKVKYTIDKKKLRANVSSIVTKMQNASNKDEKAQIIQNVGQQFHKIKEQYGEDAALELTTEYANSINMFLGMKKSMADFSGSEKAKAEVRELEVLLQEIGNLRKEIKGEKKEQTEHYWHSK